MRLALKVIPKAGQDKIDGVLVGDNGPYVKLRVTAVPEDGKANKAVVKLLAKAWGVPKSALSIVIGETSRDKVIEIENGGDKVRRWLEEQGSGNS